jgi:hypothetical protein
MAAKYAAKPPSNGFARAPNFCHFCAILPD